jgi:dihydrofolate reductase
VAGRLRVFIATSLDGFIAGPGDDLSWLPEPRDDEDHGYGAFIADVGALLMGRRTYEVVVGFGGEWPYGERPVLVATGRPLDAPAAPSVRTAAGRAEELRAAALGAAGGRDVYVDGGALIRTMLAAGLVDEMTITLVPVVLGDGVPLLGGLRRRLDLETVDARRFDDGLVQLTYAPRQGTPGNDRHAA